MPEMTGKEIKARLDKMVEGKTTIEAFESISKSSQSFKDFLEDLKEHIDHYAGDLAKSLEKVAATDPEKTGVQLLTELSVSADADKALRRLLLQYTKGEAKKFIRARPLLGGLEVWREMSRKYDAMTASRAMADSAKLTNPPIARDWAELSRLLTSYQEETMKFEARTGKEEHLPDRFKRQAVWSMVPEKEKEMLQHVKESAPELPSIDPEARDPDD